MEVLQQYRLCHQRRSIIAWDVLVRCDFHSTIASSPYERLDLLDNRTSQRYMHYCTYTQSPERAICPPRSPHDIRMYIALTHKQKSKEPFMPRVFTDELSTFGDGDGDTTGGTSTGESGEYSFFGGESGIPTERMRRARSAADCPRCVPMDYAGLQQWASRLELLESLRV